MTDRFLRDLCLAATCVLSFLSMGPAIAADHGDLGVVVLHGKWDSPNGNASGLANYLIREGFRVSKPEMPWSDRRAYAQGVDAMVAEISKAASELRTAGAKKIFVVGHSQGAIGSVYYASQQQVDGIALIAVGGHTQGKTYVAHYGSAVAEAKGLVAQGKGSEKLRFEDLNTGGRKRSIKSPAQSVLDYFDPEGPCNSELSAARIKPGTRVLIVIPRDEVQPLKGAAKKVAKSLPAEIRAQTVEVDGDHLHAPDAAKAAVRDWLLAL